MKGFVKVSHDIITETSISVGARLVLIYLNSKPKDWQFFMQDIAAQLGLSYNLTQKYVKELEKAGLLLRKREQKKGVFCYSWKASNSTATRVTVTHFTGNGETANGRAANGETANGETANGETVNDDTANGEMGSIVRIEESKNKLSNNKETNIERRALSRNLKNSDEGFKIPVAKLEQVFQEHQEKHFARPFDFDGKEYKNLQQIGEKLVKQIQENGEEVNSENIVNSFGHFLQHSAECSNGWYLNNHFTPSGLNSQFKKILNTKNDGTKKGHDYSDEGLFAAAVRVAERYDRNKQGDGAPEFE